MLKFYKEYQRGVKTLYQLSRKHKNFSMTCFLYDYYRENIIQILNNVMFKIIDKNNLTFCKYWKKKM